MPIAIYIKEDPIVRLKRKKSDRRFFAVMATLGFLAIVFAVGPYFAWQIKTLPRLVSQSVDVPIPNGKVLSSGTYLNGEVQVIENNDGFSYFTTNFKPAGSRPKDFIVSIPKLKIEVAKTLVDSLKFDKNLSHFPGTALPGEVGNSFITGHSLLPQFNDPKNFRAIFTKLEQLEVGDDVYVDFEGKRFHYIVQYLKVVSPKDLSVLSPISQNGKNLTLMTCVPPGTNIKRLVVVTSLI